MRVPSGGRRSCGFFLFRGDELYEEGIACAGGFECELTGTGDFVVFARRTLPGIGDGLFFPVGADEEVALKSPHGWVDGAAGQAGHLHDAEPVYESSAHGLEDEGCGMREFDAGRHATNIPM